MVPNPKQLMALAKQRQVHGSWEEICNNPEMEREVLRIITEAAVSGGRGGGFMGAGIEKGRRKEAHGKDRKIKEGRMNC